MPYPIFISNQTELNHFFKSYTDILFKKNERFFFFIGNKFN